MLDLVRVVVAGAGRDDSGDDVLGGGPEDGEDEVELDEAGSSSGEDEDSDDDSEDDSEDDERMAPASGSGETPGLKWG